MIPDYSNSELQGWLDSRRYELGRFGPLGHLCERMVDEIPEIVLNYIQNQQDGYRELGDWTYFPDRGGIVRIGKKLDKYCKTEYDPDKDVLLIREKSDGTKIEITRRELKIASGDAEILQKPVYSIFQEKQ